MKCFSLTNRLTQRSTDRPQHSPTLFYMIGPITQCLVFTTVCSAVAVPVKVIRCCLFFILVLINPYWWMESFWERQADLSRSKHYWLYAACTLSQCFLIYTRSTSLNKLLVGMWTCMPRLTAAKRLHLSESLWGDADVSYYLCHWNVALFLSMPFGFTVAPSIFHVHMWNSPVCKTHFDSLLIIWPFTPFNYTLSYSRLYRSAAGRKWGIMQIL